MSRSGYDESCDGWELIRWRGAVASAVRGKRGQALLLELASLMDTMPERKLAKHVFERDGEFCALGLVGHARGIDMSRWQFDDDDWNVVANALGISEALAREIMYINDEWGTDDAERWRVVRNWIDENLKGAAQRRRNGR